MARLKRIRAVGRVIDLVEGLIAAFDEVADELAQMEDEVADAAMLSTVSDRLASAKVALTPRSRCCVPGRKTPTPTMTATRAGAELKIAIARSPQCSLLPPSTESAHARACTDLVGRARSRGRAAIKISTEPLGPEKEAR